MFVFLEKSVKDKISSVTKLKAFVCLHTSKPLKMPTGVCSKESTDLFKEIVLSPEIQVSLSKTWLTPGCPLGD